MTERGGVQDDGRAVIRSLWEHHWWCLGQILLKAHELSEEEFTRDLRLSYGSFHGALAHLVGSEQVWAARVRRGESLAQVPGVAEMPDLAAVEAAWQDCKRDFQAIIDAGDFARTVEYRNTKGASFSDPLWLVLSHLVDHGAAYRGVLISALRLLGHTPPVTGLIFYARQKGRRSDE